MKQDRTATEDAGGTPVDRPVRPGGRRHKTMKNCTDCKHAKWKRTDAGRLHPSGDGMCTLQYKVPPLPACMYWIGNPKPMGGSINRKQELQEHCTYYARA